MLRKISNFLVMLHLGLTDVARPQQSRFDCQCRVLGELVRDPLGECLGERFGDLRDGDRDLNLVPRGVYQFPPGDLRVLRGV